MLYQDGAMARLVYCSDLTDSIYVQQIIAGRYPVDSRSANSMSSLVQLLLTSMSLYF